MQTAQDVMSKDPVSISANAEIAEAARLLLEKKFNGLPVVDDDGQLVGILCQSDLIAQQKRLKLPSVFTLLDGFFPLSSEREFEREMEKITATRVEQAMTRNPVHVTPDTPLEEVATIMAEKKLYTLPVVQDDRLVGVVGKEDILRALLESTK